MPALRLTQHICTANRTQTDADHNPGPPVVRKHQKLGRCAATITPAAAAIATCCSIVIGINLLPSFSSQLMLLLLLLLLLLYTHGLTAAAVAGGSAAADLPGGHQWTLRPPACTAASTPSRPRAIFTVFPTTTTKCCNEPIDGIW
jgi:hypothetical protein